MQTRWFPLKPSFPRFSSKAFRRTGADLRQTSLSVLMRCGGSPFGGDVSQWHPVHGKRLYETQPRPLTVSNHRIGSSVGFSGVLEIDARLGRIRSHYLVATNNALRGKIC